MKTKRFLTGHGSKSGFSFVEVLVVVTLITVLAAVLVPTMASVKKRTKSVKCVENLRQIGNAIMLYAADNGGFPHSSHVSYWADWGETLIPYMEGGKFRSEWVPGEPWGGGLLKKAGTFQHLAHEVGQGSKNKNTGQVTWPGWSYFTCPEAPASRAMVPPWDGNWVHVYGHNYSCNEYLMPSNWSGNWVGGMPIPKVKPQNLERPGSLILLCDSGVTAAEYESYDTLPNTLDGIINDFVSDPAGAPSRGSTPVITPTVCDNDLGPGAGWPVYRRHNGFCNALMADGHVERFRNGEMQRRNFVSHGKTKRWGGAVDYVQANYP